MKWISNGLRFLWSIWWWVVFSLVALIYSLFLFPISLLAPTRFKEGFYRMSYKWVPRFLLWPCLVFWRSQGGQNISEEGQYIVISNHQSTLDLFINPGSCAVMFKYLSKDEIRRLPFIGKIASNFCVFVDRRNKESRSKSFDNMVQAVESGNSILVYPEGTRNRTPAPLKDFYDGAFRLAILTQTPIIVQTITNSRELMAARNEFNLKPGVVNCYWDGPLPVSNYTIDQLEDLKRDIREVMLARFEAGINR